jgi:hypothetical protein
MLPLLYALFATAGSSLRPQRELALENLALRQQLAILKRKTKRPRLTQAAHRHQQRIRVARVWDTCPKWIPQPGFTAF